MRIGPGLLDPIYEAGLVMRSIGGRGVGIRKSFQSRFRQQQIGEHRLDLAGEAPVVETQGHHGVGRMCISTQCGSSLKACGSDRLVLNSTTMATKVKG